MAEVSEAVKPNGPTTRKSKRKNAKKDKEQQQVVDTDESSTKDTKESEKDESPTRSCSSPDPNCAICLSKLENKSFTDSCFHMFCFVCLQEWSKIKAECPLCKQPFKSIIHNVRSYDDYDQYYLERSENQFSYDAQNDRRFRYRTTMAHDHMFGFRPRRTVANLLTTMTTRQHWRRQRQAATSDFRRRVYTNGMRVVSLRDSSGRSRNISPEFFSSNPATMHRLVPWLNRELNALLYNREGHVQFVLELILDLIKRFQIQSDEFYQHVYPFIGRHTRHFMHEFETFARSPFHITSFDQKAVYEQQPEFVSDSDSNHSNGNDSDVMIVSPSASPGLTYRRRDPGAVRQHNPRTEITPVSVSLRDLLEEDDDQVTARSGWESPIPGPSWHLGLSNSAPGSQQPGSSSHSSNQRKENSSDVKVEGNSASRQDSESHVIDSGSDSGSDILCVGYDKPWQERTPVILSSDSEEEIIRKAEKAKKKKSKREESSRHRRRQSNSRSRSRSRSRHRVRSISSSRSNYRRSRSQSTSRTHSRYPPSNSRSRRSRSKSSQHRRYRSPSPYSKSRHSRHDTRSIPYEDAFGYSRRTTHSPDRSRKKRKRDRHRSSRYSDSSRSKSRSPSRHRRDRHKGSRQSRRQSRSSSTEMISNKHRHKKHKKHKKSKDADKERQSGDNVHYKIVNDKEKKTKGDPLLSITIKRDKSEEFPEVSSTVDTSQVEVEMDENVVIRTEPITPPRPDETATVSSVYSNESNPPTASSAKTLETEKTEENPKPRKEDTDSSNDCVEVRRKHFKKHPSGHKKSRRPLARLPDPTSSTVTSSTSQPDQQMPVLDVISQIFQGFNSSNITSTQVSQESLIPGMMENFFDSRLSHLYGYQTSNPLSDFLPRSTPTQVTSKENPLVLSSSDDSDVVVESVTNGSGPTVSSSNSYKGSQGFQGMMYNILDSIPIISEDIASHKSVEVEETIDVEALDNDSLPLPRAAASGSVEVIDSEDEIDVTSIPSRSVEIPDADNKSGKGAKEPDVGSSKTNPQETSSGININGKSSSSKDVSAEGNNIHDKELLSSLSESPPGQSKDKHVCSLKESSPEEEPMDIDVTGSSSSEDVNEEVIKPISKDISPKNQDVSDESMSIDVVGGVDISDHREDALVSEPEPSTSSTHDIEPTKPFNSLFELSQERTENLNVDIEPASSVDKSLFTKNQELFSAETPESVSGINVSSSSENIAAKYNVESRFGASQSNCETSELTSSPIQQSSESSESEDSPRNPKRQIIEGASEISSEEDSIVQMDSTNVIADASDISSDEVTFDEDSRSLPASMSQPTLKQTKETSSDEGEISSDSDDSEEGIGASDVSTDNNSVIFQTDSITNFIKSTNRSSGRDKYSHKPSSSHHQASRQDIFAEMSSVLPDSATSSSNRSRCLLPSTTKDESLSSGEISEDSSDKVYDDISSSENFDSADSPGDRQMDKGHQPHLPTSSAGQPREEDSLSEGEIVSD